MCVTGAAEYSWPAVVLWWLTSSQFFFGFGHHATVTSLRFDAGFVGLRGEMSGLSLLFAGLLVGINMLGSHVSLPPVLVTRTCVDSVLYVFGSLNGELDGGRVCHGERFARAYVCVGLN